MNQRISKWKEKIELVEFPQPDYLPLRYPVVLCHGYGSIASIFKPTPLHEACMLLRSHGVLAFAPNVVPYAAIEDRAKDWIRHIQFIIDQTKAQKVNVIAHSMGGLDLRYAISELGLGDRVASLTTMATPHKGSSLAELGLNTPGRLRDLLGEVFNWLGTNMYTSMKSDVLAALNDLTRAHITQNFNPVIKDHPKVHYFSWSAGVGKGTKESINSVLIPLNLYIYEQEGVNDGFVSTNSAIWGDHLGQLGLSHTEQIHLNVMRSHKERWMDVWIESVKTINDAGY